MSATATPTAEVMVRHLAEAATRIRWQATEEDVADEVGDALRRLELGARLIPAAVAGSLAPGSAIGHAVGRALVQRRTGHLQQQEPGLVAKLVGAPAELAAAGSWSEVLLLPVVVHEQTVSLIAVGASAFTLDRVAILELFVGQVAAALEHQHLVAQIVRRNEELALLNRLAQESSAGALPQVLEIAVQTVAHLTEAEAVALYLSDPRDAHWTLAASTGAPPGDFERTLPAQAVTRPPNAPPLAGKSWRACGTTWVHPVALRGRVSGAMVVGRADTAPPSFETGALISTAAAQLAVHVDNARLLGEHVQRERLVALGELAAVVAHEVRNPLGAIFNAVSSLRRLMTPSPDGRMLLDIVGEEASRLNRVVGDLLDFARAPQPHFEQGDLAGLLDEVLRVACATTDPLSVEVVRVDAGPLPPISFDARLMHQALVNVALNAVQAMPRGGRLWVRTSPDPALPTSICIEFEDTGPGVPEPLRERIFEPFFTTKASGTGLGLAVVKRIIDDHRGKVSVRAPLGRGTIVAISLPLSPTGGVSESRSSERGTRL